jgi:hypothetical protein
MKPRTNFDPMFQTDGQPPLPLRSIGLLMIVLALGVSALRAGPIPRRRPASRPSRVAPVPGARVPAPSPFANPRASSPLAPQDQFFAVAPAEVDPAMVVQARADLDEGMLFNPDTRRRGPASADPDPAGAEPLPDPGPNPFRPR